METPVPIHTLPAGSKFRRTASNGIPGRIGTLLYATPGRAHIIMDRIPVGGVSKRGKPLLSYEYATDVSPNTPVIPVGEQEGVSL